MIDYNEWIKREADRQTLEERWDREDRFVGHKQEQTNDQSRDDRQATCPVPARTD